MMRAIKNKKIAVVGGGPGGLTLARILQMKGADVNVYERDLNKDARVQGATLDLHEESGLRALSEAGLTKAFEENYRPGADRLRIMDKNAHIHLDDHINGKEDISRPEIDRGPLRKILLDSLDPSTVVWNSQFVSMSRQNGNWQLVFQNGTRASVDIVIGADGANSKIRPYITPIKPFFAGVTAVEGAVYNSESTIPKIHALLKDGKIFAMSDEKTLIIGSKGDGSIAFYTGSKTEEGWSHSSGINFSDKANVMAWFKKEFAGWNDVWLELFEKAEYPLMPRPQYCMPLDKSWQSLPDLTMIGDAAHLMPPYAGEGVNMAMLDALELGNCLLDEQFNDAGAAIAFYEKQMLARASQTAADTLESTAALHSRHAISFILDVLNGTQ